MLCIRLRMCMSSTTAQSFVIQCIFMRLQSERSIDVCVYFSRSHSHSLLHSFHIRIQYKMYCQNKLKEHKAKITESLGQRRMLILKKYSK